MKGQPTAQMGAMQLADFEEIIESELLGKQDAVDHK